MITLHYDLETTGLVSNRLPPAHPSQPRMVQLGALLCDGDDVVSSVDVIVDPLVEVPQSAANVHGITTERARKFGVTEIAAAGMLLRLAQKADMVVGYNSDRFDKVIVAGTLERLLTTDAWRDWLNLAHRDAGTTCTDLVKMPPTPRMVEVGMGDHFKMPKLSEAYEHVTGKPLEGAHSALVDCHALKVVWEWCKAREEESQAADFGNEMDAT